MLSLMETATAPRSNTFAGSCAKCHRPVAAGEGSIFKKYPFHSSPWFVKCGDEQSCSSLVAEAIAVQGAESAARRAAKPEVIEAIALGEANLHLPKTIVISWGDAEDQSVKIIRRISKKGCRLTNPFEGHLMAAPYDSEAEAVASMIRSLRIAARPFKIESPEQIAAIEKFLESVTDPA
jgi:hypothetical protein